MSQTRTTSKARQRIIETANALFYSEGIRAVGIDRIIAQAGVAKMTLYNHFSSKDDLILEVLKFREQQFTAFFDDTVSQHVEKGADRIEAFFATLDDWFTSQGFRGCSFINAAVELADPEHPASQFAADHKHRSHQRLTELIKETVDPEAAVAAPAIALLAEGAIVAALVKGDRNAAHVAKDAALALLGHAMAPP